MCYKYYSFLLACEDCALSYAASKASYYIVAFKFQWKRSKFGFLCCFILTKFFEDILKLRRKKTGLQYQLKLEKPPYIQWFSLDCKLPGILGSKSPA